MNWGQALLDGLVIGAVFNGTILLLMRTRPRSMAHMLPASMIGEERRRDLRADAGPFYRAYVPMLVLVVAMMLIGGVRVYAGIDASFWDLFWHGYVIGMFMNLGDGIFLDLVEIPAHREFYAREWSVDPELLRPAAFSRRLTIVEHGLLWPLVVCPIVGLVFALGVGAFLG